MIDRMNKVIDELAPVLKSLDWSNPKVYAWWLSQAFCIARQSTSFLGLTMIHSKAYPAFLERCTDHISEETGHEKLIMNDLKALGIEMLPELPATSAIYQTQYYRIVAESPLSFVGYIFLLELLAPAFGPWVMEQVPNKKALSFLKVHAAADEDHIEKASIILETLTPEQRDLAYSNFEMTASSYRQMLLAIKGLTEAA